MTRSLLPLTSHSLDIDLFSAIRRDDEAEVRRLLTLGANPLANIKHTPSATFMACQLGVSPGILEALIEAGADVTALASPISNETHLHLAARSGRAGLVRVLIEAGVDPYVEAREGALTALAMASNGSVVHALVECGVDINHRNSEGHVALAHMDNLQAVIAAIELGADTALRTIRNGRDMGGGRYLGRNDACNVAIAMAQRRKALAAKVVRSGEKEQCRRAL